MTTEARLPLADSNVAVVTEPRRLQIVCWIALIAIAAARAWFTRYELMGGDSLAYLDIARAVSEGHPGLAVHACWSPGYPVVIALFLWLFRPNPFWEAPLVHFVNVLIFIGTLAAFQLFWRELLRLHIRVAGDSVSEIPGAAFWALGYAVFGIAALNLIRVGLLAPDLMVAAFCFLAAWSALRFCLAPGVGRALLLGLVLGLGYYVKAPFFPMAFVFILCASASRPLSRRVLLLGGLSLITFLTVCAPFIAALSVAKGRFTFGDSARLNQAFYINGVQHYEHWQGGPPGAGTPVHPTRKLSDYPEIYEFAARDMGTYPPWFDPTYWYEGITPHLNFRRQTIVFVRNIALEFQIIMESGAEIVCVSVFLVLLAAFHAGYAKRFLQVWFIWIPGVLALAMFALVHVEPRYIGGWPVLIFAGVVSACRLSPSADLRRTMRCIGAAALITSGASLLLQASREAIGADHAAGRSARNASIAIFLLNHGLHPGDAVALIGNGTEAYWAHLARVHLVAEIPAHIASLQDHPARDFWESKPETQKKALDILARTGARAVIAGSQLSLDASVPSTVPAPWKEIGETGAYVYLFPESH